MPPREKDAAERETRRRDVQDGENRTNGEEKKRVAALNRRWGGAKKATVLLDNMIAACPSEVTARNHVKRIATLLSLMLLDSEADARRWGQQKLHHVASVDDILTTSPKALIFTLANPKRTLQRILVAYRSIPTRMAFVNPLLSLFRNNPDLAADLREERIQYLKTYRNYTRMMQALRRERMPSERQLQQYTPFQDIIAKYRDATADETGDHTHMTLDHQTKLLLSLVVFCRPKRADHADMRIFIDPPQQDPMLNDENYLVIRRDGAASIDTPVVDYAPLPPSDVPGPRDSFMVFVTHKTRGSYERVREVVHPVFVRDVLQSLQEEPRTHLFTNRFRRPYSRNTWSKHVSNTFAKLFGRATGLNVWRHTYTTERLDMHQDAPRRLDKEARLMLHSRAIQDKYVWSRRAVCEGMKTMCESSAKAS